MKSLSLKAKLTLVIILVSTFFLVIAVGISTIKARDGLQETGEVSQKAVLDQVYAQLEAIRDNKKANIADYFSIIEKQCITFSEDVSIIDAAREYKKAFKDYAAKVTPDDLQMMRGGLKQYYLSDFANEYEKQNKKKYDIESYFSRLSKEAIVFQYAYIHKNPNPLGSKHRMDRAVGEHDYHAIHNKYHPYIRSYLESFGYYDIFIVDIETGHIVYSVFKELDFGTSLLSGPNAQTNFGECFKRASYLNSSSEAVLVDFKCYTPSYEAPASFIGSPIFDGDQKIAVAIFQMPLDTISSVMSLNSGLGKTGDSYLVGSDSLMRSNSFHDAKRSVLESFKTPSTGSVKTEQAISALNGKTASGEGANYAGISVLSSSAPVTVGGLHWAIVAEIDKEEALQGLTKLKELEVSVQSGLIYYGIGLVIISIFLSFGITIFVAKAFSGPIERSLSRALKVDATAQNNRIALDGVVRSVHEMTDVIKEISENSTNTAKTTVEAVNIATRVSSKIQKLFDESTKINNILADISEIASRTDLIALNATIEAASAGEAGKSFAVVANEVKTLAEKISVAADEINQKISETQKGLKDSSDEIILVANENKTIESATSQLASAIEELSITSENINASVGEVSAETAEVIKQLKHTTTDLKVLIHGRKEVVACEV
ncbi:MAG: hypothetical protein HQL31_03470 [Planctomycetes bacterium]|nr:hypothetical protein [Planctomycetota bacterium]